MAVRLQLLSFPATWFTFGDDGILTLIEVEADRPFEFGFDRRGREWGPYTVDAGSHQISVPRGQGKTFEDVSNIWVRDLLWHGGRGEGSISLVADG